MKIVTEKGHEIARGIVNYTKAEAELIKGVPTRKLEGILGHKSYDEVIHRDHLVVLTGFDK